MSEHDGKENTLQIFDKCGKFTTSLEAKRAGLYPYFRMICSAQDTEVIIGKKRMLMLGSNSYMGLTNDPRVKKAAIEATEKYGSGCAGSRFLNGTLDIHIKLEERLAQFCDKESALVFTTGFQTNLGTISALVGKDDFVFIDKCDHASIIDGCRLGFGKIVKFEHNNPESLEDKLKGCEPGGKLIVVDGVYSMEGDIARLPQIVEAAQRYGAAVMVDDAHSIGVLGKRGNGTADHFGLTDRVDIIMGTFSKSFASIGGFVASSSTVIEYLKHHSRAMIFSASPTPACAAAVLTSIDIIEKEPERREKLWHNTYKMLNTLKDMGFDTGLSETPIIPLIIGDNMDVFRFWRYLHDAGIFVNPIVSPAVPPNQALIRISVMATHTDKQLDRALRIINKGAKELGLLTKHV
jgi:8-amino-7-oxononanoate synthase